MTRRELATVLHALRIYQETMGTPQAATNAIKRESEACDHFGDDPPLNAKQIDALCERLNFKGR